MHILAIGKQPFLVFLYKNMTKIIHIWTQPCSWRGVLYTTLCHKVCQWFAAGRLFSLDTPVFLHPWNWPPRYNRNIVDIGVKHHNPISEHKLVTTVFGYLESLSSYKSKRFVFVVVLKAMVIFMPIVRILIDILFPRVINSRNFSGSHFTCENTVKKQYIFCICLHSIC
jgi:hypothetical protein